MIFSASRIKTWMDCSLQAKFKYIDQLPEKQNAAATWGNALHMALEEYPAHNDGERAVARFLEIWDAPEKFGLKIDTWPNRTSHGSYRDLGCKILRQHHEETRWVSKDVIATEHPFKVPFGKHTLTGFVDALESKPNDHSRLRILDYKSASTQPYRSTLYLNIQFTVYDFASKQPEFWLGYPGEEEKFPGFPNGKELYEEFKNSERYLIWYHLRTAKEIYVGPRDDPDYLRLYRCCNEIERAIEQEVHVPDISGNTCSFCSFVDVCCAYVPPPEIIPVRGIKVDL